MHEVDPEKDYLRARVLELEEEGQRLAKKLVELEKRAPSPERLEEIAATLDFFDQILELGDALLPGEGENYRAVDHSAMQDDLRRWARATASGSGEPTDESGYPAWSNLPGARRFIRDTGNR